MKKLIGSVAAVVILVASAAFAGIVIENKNLNKMEVVGDKLFLIKQSGRAAAPDGTYFLRDDSSIIVVNGRIDKANSSALKTHPDLAAEVGGKRQTSKGLASPGSIKKFDPQPEPPGHQLTPAGQQAR